MQRRNFLGRSFGGAVALGAAPPLFVARSGWAATPARDSRALVILELAGGNDGLNTVAPYSDPSYQKARPGVGLKANEILKLNDQLGLHPKLAGLKKLWDDGLLGIVQGVGYPNPNRSHFRSMDIWQSARPEIEDTSDGWLGRALDAGAAKFQGATPAVALGNERLPLALASRTVAVPNIQDMDHYRIGAGDGLAAAGRKQALLKLADGTGDDELAFLRRTARTAYASAERLADLAKKYKPAAEYPDSHLGKQFRTVAQMLLADLGTRIFYVSLGGFDTHAQQAAVHATLLGNVGDTLRAFQQDLAKHGLAERVAILTFSEFGRRVKENGSLGTDHGAASQVFVVRPPGHKGGQAGLIGAHPSLTDLDDGDLKHHTDFRQVYAAALANWLGLDARAALGKDFAPAPIL